MPYWYSPQGDPAKRSSTETPTKTIPAGMNPAGMRLGWPPGVYAATA